jgi:mono/diheme cytochrome c family protein
MINMPLRPPSRRFALIALACTAAAATTTPAWAQSQIQEQGRRVAKSYCGQCHGLGEGPSPLPAAPPFAKLYRRYPVGGGLEDLLGEGMIAPAIPQEEGEPRLHPRMPQARLDEDQVAALVAFLKAVQEPGPRHP